VCEKPLDALDRDPDVLEGEAGEVCRVSAQDAKDAVLGPDERVTESLGFLERSSLHPTHPHSEALPCPVTVDARSTRSTERC
jgi:hypothetical protein